MKQRPWAEHLAYQKGGWVLFSVFPHLTMKECPCHVYSDSMPLQQIIEQTIAYNWVTQWLRSRVLTAHNTVNGTMSPVWVGGGRVQCTCAHLYTVLGWSEYLRYSGYSDIGVSSLFFHSTIQSSNLIHNPVQSEIGQSFKFNLHFLVVLSLCLLVCTCM